MRPWQAFPFAGEFHHTPTSVKKQWLRLHAGDRESVPVDRQALHAWVLFHNGAFHAAVVAGLQAGAAGLMAANKATCIYANYLEPDEAYRLELFLEVANRAAALAQDEPANANAWYWQAYALGRYSQGISVAKALALGLGTRVRDALERTIQLEPQHADAHLALGAFHAEVIDKVGSLIGSMTYGAKKETGLRLYQTARLLNPQSAIGMVEYANALVMMDGDKRHAEALALYQKASASQPADAMERLDVELAKVGWTG